MGSYVINTMDYNYKLRSVIGREDHFKTNKPTRFDTQVCAPLLWSRMISMVLVDYTDMRGIISHILDDVLAPHVSIDNSIRIMTSYIDVSMVVHLGSNNHLQICSLIHGNRLSSSSKKQRKENVPSKNGILEIDYKMTINMLMKHLYIVVQYFYMTNWLISGHISRDIYKSTKILKSHYFAQAIQGKIININPLELTEVNVIKRIRSKWVRL